MQIIQQWQYIDKLHEKLLRDETFTKCKQVGVTSLQSYVTWAEIEKEKDCFDFSAYDPLVEKIKQHRLKWVPFLIAGPYYATPKWFLESDQCVFAKCLAHGLETKIQSVWNPHLMHHVGRFLNAFSNHYNDPDLIESISLGINGNWGEAIYPASGCFHGGFHVHPGWWCGDIYALKDFQTFFLKKYGSVERLNRIWGTRFTRFTDICFPEMTGSKLENLLFSGFLKLPANVRVTLSRMMLFIKNSQVMINLGKYHTPKSPDLDEGETIHRIDFIQWYHTSMTKWSESWIRKARQTFPKKDIYLVSGGKGEPLLGADFSAQTKVAAKYDAGIRITNQNDDYAQSFVRTRLVSAACRKYGTYFSTEEAGINRPHGIPMRLFDAVSSGARGLYFKELIGIGENICDKNRKGLGEYTENANNLKHNLNHIIEKKPLIDIAVFFPTLSFMLDPSLLNKFYAVCTKLRSYIDFDFLDERLICDGKLADYRFLLLISGNVMGEEVLAGIKNWTADGGICISSFRAIHLKSRDGLHLYRYSFLFDNGIRKYGKGYFYLHKTGGPDYIRFLAHIISNPRKTLPWESAWISDNGYATLFDDRIISYDPQKSVIHTRKR